MPSTNAADEEDEADAADVAEAEAANETESADEGDSDASRSSGEWRSERVTEANDSAAAADDDDDDAAIPRCSGGETKCRADAGAPIPGLRRPPMWTALVPLLLLMLLIPLWLKPLLLRLAGSFADNASAVCCRDRAGTAAEAAAACACARATAIRCSALNFSVAAMLVCVRRDSATSLSITSQLCSDDSPKRSLSSSMRAHWQADTQTRTRNTMGQNSVRTYSANRNKTHTVQQIRLEKHDMQTRSAHRHGSAPLGPCRT